MRNQSPRSGFAAASLMAALLFLPACSLLAVRPATPAKQPAEDWLALLHARTSGLKASKGIGRYSYRSANRRQSARFAWAAQYPSRIRLQVFAVTGQPLLILAADGGRVRIFSARENRVYSRSADDALLQKIIDLPVSLEDLIRLLCGRIPLRAYFHAGIQPAAAGKGWVVVLTKPWGGVSEKIYLDARRRVQRLQIFSFSGKPAYGVRWVARRRIDGFDTPKRLVLTGPDQRRVQLVVERFWVNPELSAGIFKLKAPT